MKKGLCHRVGYQATFDWDEELVHPRSLPSYLIEKQKFLERTIVQLSDQMDIDRIEERKKFNEIKRAKGLMPIPDDPEYDTEPAPEIEH